MMRRSPYVEERRFGVIMAKVADLLARQTYVQFFDPARSEDLQRTILVVTSLAGGTLFREYDERIIVCRPGENSGVYYICSGAGDTQLRGKKRFVFRVAYSSHYSAHAVLRDACVAGDLPEVAVCIRTGTGRDDKRVVLVRTECLRAACLSGQRDDPCVRPKRPPYLRVVK